MELQGGRRVWSAAPGSVAVKLKLQPLISIVAPVYNESATLAEFVRRIGAVCDTLEGRYTSEIVLVDDGSTDGTLAVARGLIDRERRPGASS
jgi:glycosyltransferase involved in cell wall biosynthesis